MDNENDESKLFNFNTNGKIVKLKQRRRKEIKTLEDVTNINELNQLIGDDEISEEEYQDMVKYIQDKNSSNK